MAETSTLTAQGRAAYRSRSWSRAHALLSRAEAEAELGAADVELLATAAYLLGRDDEHRERLRQAHRRHLDAGDPLRAARMAFWLGISLALGGEPGQADGWLGRARRLVQDSGADCVERGYMLLPVGLEHSAAGRLDEAAETAAAAARIATRFGDDDLLALSLQDHGQALLRQGDVEEGLRLLDEAMVAVTNGELSPVVTGLVYCGVIDGCRMAYEPARAQEWTAALARWCDDQPEMVPYSGQCHVHRAELMQLHGDWGAALSEARRARARFAARLRMNERAAAEASYREGEVLRLRGVWQDAERAYAQANRLGREPQPGLALLRLAQDDRAAALAAIRRAAEEASDRVRRAEVLPALVEILLACRRTDDARRACEELAQLAPTFASTLLDAVVAHARAAVELERGEHRRALRSARDAVARWQELRAPYELARSRVLIALCCRALGDEDSATLELAAASLALRELGAVPDAERADALAGAGEPAGPSHGLTGRELQVLELVARGRQNREIASELVISEHTVARHVQNIFAKLGVSSRTAAGAFAFEHGLVAPRGGEN